MQPLSSWWRDPTIYLLWGLGLHSLAPFMPRRVVRDHIKLWAASLVCVMEYNGGCKQVVPVLSLSWLVASAERGRRKEGSKASAFPKLHIIWLFHLLVNHCQEPHSIQFLIWERKQINPVELKALGLWRSIFLFRGHRVLPELNLLWLMLITFK